MPTEYGASTDSIFLMLICSISAISLDADAANKHLQYLFCQERMATFVQCMVANKLVDTLFTQIILLPMRFLAIAF
jgi:hypothetical protein